MESPFVVKGKSILVTGAASGIGRATALLCAKIVLMIPALHTTPSNFGKASTNRCKSSLSVRFATTI